MAITFPRVPPRCTQNTTVAFEGELNGVPVTCEISGEALMDHFGATAWDSAHLVASFELNRGIIDAAASAVLPARAPAGRCLLVSADF
jgi:hypothetical protein